MSEVLDRDAETVVIAQVEDPVAIANVGEIAAVSGIDALFAGPADLSVGMGKRELGSPEVREALGKIASACRSTDTAYAAWVPDIARAEDWREFGVSMFVVASDHGFLRMGAAAAALRLQP